MPCIGIDAVIKRRVLSAAFVAAVLAFVFVVPFIKERIEKFAVGTHQRAVTHELAAWEQEYGKVSTRREAERAIDMLEYVQQYYVPSPGYRSDPKTETDLGIQRGKTLDAIVAALQKFTDQDFGADFEQWRAWSTKTRPSDAGKR